MPPLGSPRAYPNRADRLPCAPATFSGLTNARTGAPIPVLEPIRWTRNLPATSSPVRLSQQALAFLHFVPQPNTANGTFNFLHHARSAPSLTSGTTLTPHRPQFLHRKDQISGRYLFNDTYEAGIPFWGHDERNNLGRTQGVEAPGSTFSAHADQ